MIRVQQFDHISMAVPALDPQIEFLEKVFGFRFTGKFESDEGYFGASLAIPGRSGLDWELLAPRNDQSYLHRFLAGPSGPGLHHIALQIDSAVAAAEEIRAQGMEPWGFRTEHAHEGGDGVVYLHPKGGGRGFLWQMYAGAPWHESHAFEDDREDTLGIVAVNHLAHAAYDAAEMSDWYQRVFGCTEVYASPSDGASSGFRTRVLDTPTKQLRFETIEPAGEGSFIARFLERRGEGMHHINFEVGDFERAVRACELHNVPTFGVRSGTRDGYRWSEAFIHPQHTGGMLVQFFWEEAPGIWI